MIFYCAECGGETVAVEEAFDYAGTHCNHGKAGTHRTGLYVSECCGGELLDYDPTLSECCGESIIENTDLCSRCKEHTGVEI